jgi:pimeloyl-ACP methyl ester carboxylesterase
MSPDATSPKTAPPAVPDAHTTFDVVAHDGAVIRVRQHGVADGPRLVISHGNGLAVDGYFPFWGPLCDRYEVIVFDMRNHGQNPVHELEAHDWANFARDIGSVHAGIEAELGAKPATGIFHSLSAAAGLADALDGKTDWHALVAVDIPCRTAMTATWRNSAAAPAGARSATARWACSNSCSAPARNRRAGSMARRS